MTPAGRLTRKLGSEDAVCTRAVISGEMDNVVIIHDAPTVCIQVPTFDASAAIHTSLKLRCLSGVQALRSDMLLR
jgi:hypothetical protein